MNSPKVGDYLCGTWGYDATILTGAVVVGVAGGSIKVRECEQERKYTGGGGMFWVATPLVDKLSGPVMTKRAKPCGDGYCVKWNSYLTLYLSTPTPVECSNTH